MSELRASFSFSFCRRTVFGLCGACAFRSRSGTQFVFLIRRTRAHCWQGRLLSRRRGAAKGEKQRIDVFAFCVFSPRAAAERVSICLLRAQPDRFFLN